MINFGVVMMRSNGRQDAAPAGKPKKYVIAKHPIDTQDKPVFWYQEYKTDDDMMLIIKSWTESHDIEEIYFKSAATLRHLRQEIQNEIALTHFDLYPFPLTLG